MNKLHDVYTRVCIGTLCVRVWRKCKRTYYSHAVNASYAPIYVYMSMYKMQCTRSAGMELFGCDVLSYTSDATTSVSSLGGRHVQYSSHIKLHIQISRVTFPLIDHRTQGDKRYRYTYKHIYLRAGYMCRECVCACTTRCLPLS